MITAKDAASAAIRYLVDLIPGSAHPLVEEVSITNNWHITISYTPPPISGSYNIFSGREYKVFEIDSENGTVHSMKIRSGVRND